MERGVLVILHENGKPKAADPRDGGRNSRADEERD